MAKTIKFNLIVNDTPVRDLEDLRNNFSIEDILEYYQNGLLQRWLSVRGYENLLTEVNKISGDTNLERIQQLIQTFEIEHNEQKIKEGVAILDFIEERKSLLDIYKERNYKVEEIINDYHSDYEYLVFNIIQNRDNMPVIKASIKELETNYIGLFKLNYLELYNNLITNAPLAIFAILMNETLREYFIKNEKSSGNTIKIYEALTNFVTNNQTKLKEYLGSELKIFKGNTQAYWKDLEPTGKKCMILRMVAGNYIRNAGAFGQDFSSTDVNDKFLILDGIDYKSNNLSHELLYMEV
jgi:hypothetical protein